MNNWLNDCKHMYPLLPGAEEQVKQTKQPTPIIINKS